MDKPPQKRFKAKILESFVELDTLRFRKFNLRSSVSQETTRERMTKQKVFTSRSRTQKRERFGQKSQKHPNTALSRFTFLEIQDYFDDNCFWKHLKLCDSFEHNKVVKPHDCSSLRTFLPSRHWPTGFASWRAGHLVRGLFPVV